MKLPHFFIASAISILGMYSILISSAFYFYDSAMLYEALTSDRVLSATSISLSSALIATMLAGLVALPASYALSRYSFRFKPMIDISLELPMIVSPAALGALLLIFFQAPVGHYIRENIFDAVYNFYGIVLAQFVAVLGICTRMMKAVFDEIPKRYEQIARTLGANHRQAFLKISLPLARRGILSALLLTFAKSIGEFGATITVAGSMAFKTETLPTAIFMRLSVADIRGAVVLILILIAISTLLLTTARLILRK